MSENDFREVIDEEPNDTEKSSGIVETAEENKENAEVVHTEEKPDDNEYEAFCGVCHRPEHIAGKLLHIRSSRLP